MSEADDADGRDTRDERLPWARVTAEHPVGPSRPPSPAETIGRFAIGHELGRGGMGVVLAATDRELAREVAIKQALTHRAEDRLRFEREIRITARLEHPSIIPIYDAGTDVDGQPYYVMRRIAGEPLSDRVDRSTSLPERLALLPQVVAAVDAAAYAHAHGIIHRDIKPLNILLGSHGETFLIDWGLARELDREDPPSSGPADRPPPQLTRAGQIYGTEGFMSPEQARGEPTDARSDVYALGVTLYFVLRGDVPGDGAFPWQPEARLPTELTAIVEKATAQRPEDRYRDAGELAHDLHAFLAGRIVGARRYTRRERLLRLLRRHRVAVAVLAALVAVAVAVAVVAVQRLVHERDLADLARHEADVRQRAAEDRAELALLDRASALAARDPARVLALLRQLPEDSRHLGRARDIATSAASGGVAHGLSAHAGYVHTLAWSPDGRTLASGGRDGTLQLHDLAARRSRIVFASRGEPITHIVWGSQGVLAFAIANRTVRAYDLTADRVIQLGLQVGMGSGSNPSQGGMWASSDGAHLRYFDPARKVVATRPFRDGDEVILAREVDDAVGDGDLAIVLRAGRAELLDGDARRPMPALRWTRLAIAPDHQRIAGIVGDEVVEWEVDSGTLRRWPLSFPVRVFYSAHGLYASQSTALVQLGARGVQVLASGAWSSVWSTPIQTGDLAMVTGERRLWIVDRIGPRELAFPDLDAAASAGYRQRLAIANTDGTILWWDLATPGVLAGPSRGATVCGVDRARVVVDLVAQVAVVDRATREIRSVDTPGYDCQGLAGSHVILQALSGRRVLLALASGSLDERFGMISYDPEAGVIVGATEARLDELADGKLVRRWHGGARIRALAVQGRWIAAQTDDGEVVRIDRVDGRHLTYPAQPLATTIAVSETGQVWTGTSDHLVRFDTEGPVTIASLEAPRMLHAYGDRAVVLTEDRSLVVYTSDGPSILAPGARHRELTFHGRLALAREGNGELVTYFLDSGERSVRRLPGLSSAWLSPGRELVVAWPDGRLELHPDAGPPQTASLHAWIDTATNAVLDVHGVLEWR